MAASTSKVKRQKFVCENGYVDFGARYKEHILLVKEQEADRSKALRSKALERSSKRNERNKAAGIDVLDWNELEEIELDTITFDPTDSRHAKIEETLRLSARTRVRVDLVDKLRIEFARLYSRYRRAAERKKSGRSYSAYETLPTEMKYAERAAILCIQKAVTPRQVLEYWHYHVKNFGGRVATLTVPPLSFLSSPAIIDTVACSIVPDKTAPGGARVLKSKVLTKPQAGNSFSDTSGLDMRLRSGLEEAGYPTQGYNDRFLLTVQKNALSLAAHRDIFIARGAIRDMSLWAAKNLYEENE